MHRVAHEHLGVQGATAFFEGFAQPVRVGQPALMMDFFSRRYLRAMVWAVAGDRQVRGLARIRVGLEAVDNVGGGDLPKLSVLQRPTPHITGQVNVPKRTSSSCGL
jgi:hypothetical protein